MGRKKRSKATEISPELDLDTLAQIHYMKEHQEHYGKDLCINPKCNAEMINAPLVASVPPNEQYLCTVCQVISRFEAAMTLLN